MGPMGLSLLVGPANAGKVSRLLERYLEAIDRLGLWDRELERGYAAARIAGELDAWEGRPVFAYGFEDLTGSEWALVEALAARSDLTVSLPYEPGRDAFASLTRTAEDLSALAAGSIEELPAGEEAREPVLAHLERNLWRDRAPAPPPDGSLRFLAA